jgi:hypothetical protein
MTDLERLWDDLPTSEPPVEALVRGGRRAELLAEATGAAARPPRHRFLTRPLLTAGVATAVAGVVVAGLAVGEGSDGGPPGVETLPSPAAFQADLPAAETCDELLATYVDRALPLVSAWGWGGGPSHLLERANTARAEADLITGASARKSGADVDRQVSSETGTNVQEAGVDEPDNVKTDGELLVRVRDDELDVYDVRGDRVQQRGSLTLPAVQDAELLLTGDTVVAIGRDRTVDDDGRRGTRVLTVSLADPAAPEVTDDVAYSAASVSARQHGDVIRLVLSSALPAFDFTRPDDNGRGIEAAERRNRQLVKDSTIDDWLPTVTADGETRPLLACTDVAIPDDEVPLGTVSVVGFAADAPTSVRAIGLAGATDIAYESVDHLYLAAGPASGWAPWDCIGCTTRIEPSGTSYLFDFELDGTSATHVASGEVEGSIADRWSLDEYGGVLRVAVGPSSETGNFSSVVTMAREGQELAEIGRLDGIGRNEQITSVRWFDDLAFVVTFRRIDPLYAIDLRDDRRPTLLSELKIPGFSSYLHPLGTMRMVGVGEGPSDRGWGAQVGLFDVTDLSDVSRLDVQHYPGGSRPVAGQDPRAFTWLPDHRTLLTVVSGNDGGHRVGWVSVLRLAQGRFHERRVQVEYGSDVDDVRTVPLPDGRVVLVTGDDARFFDLTPQ